MSGLHPLRSFTRLVLVWFALTAGVAMASPWLHAGTLQVVCAGDGSARLLLVMPDGAHDMSSHSLDCPLCQPTGAPPPVAHTLIRQIHGRMQAQLAPASPPPSSRAAAALPARGPPVNYS